MNTEELYKAEVEAAAKFIVKAVKPTGEIGWIEDGKLDVFIRMKLPELAKLMASYWIEHTAERLKP